MAKRPDEILNSNYDGIQEYDNDLPRWWLVLFFLTIAYAFIYLCYFQFGSAPSSEEELATNLKEIYAVQAANAPKSTTNKDIALLVKDPAHIASGREVFAARCAACHSAEGQGLVGPNLTDEFWIHGGTLTQIATTIRNGVLDKGMLAWKGVISEQEIDDVTIFIRSIRGTTPANPKAPQGEKYVGDE